MPNWTDEEFRELALHSFLKDVQSDKIEEKLNASN